jgi:hypothetical protein
LALSFPAAAEGATTYTLTSNGDSGMGTLRADLAAAGPGDTILIPGSYTITLTSPLPVTQFGAGLAIGVSGAGMPTISGNGATRIFTVEAGSRLTLRGLALAEGNAKNDGGAIAVAAGATVDVEESLFRDNGSPETFGDGAAILVQNNGKLVVRRSTLTRNYGGSQTGDGGAINANSNSRVEIEATTFSHNRAGSDTGYGGAIIAGSGTTLTVTNSTFFDNAAGAEGLGGAINTSSGQATTLLNDTIAANRAGTGGGVYAGGIGVIARNTIISGNTATKEGPNCAGEAKPPISSVGHNLEQGTSCGLTAGGDLNADPLLAGSLALNGGPTETLALAPSSPGIDAGDTHGCPLTDQRGFPRPDNGEVACDIGAYEFQDQPGSPPSNRFRIARRAKCARACRVILIAAGFDSAGEVRVTNALPRGVRPGALDTAPVRLVKTLHRPVKPGATTLRLKMTPPALKRLRKHGRLRLPLDFSFSPTGGTGADQKLTFTLRRPKKKGR